MDQPSFGTGDNPLIEIARAIGRIEALVGTAMARQNDHEERIGKLEEGAIKVKTSIALFSTVASGAIAAAVWAAEHFWK
ncbi:hypothetical protein [Phyllobacterium endophyticum]|uniref:hypothetical protein n=1 Tax=Phyllobacterium endophyticum TaxID=1149773 RepID=UPI0011CA2345|nr:hypothetical protein [Phyllobacterium endophyticum]TXR49885.1 hypothetical protein FVA77_07685 [Phyllobacterium endophyticum]